MSVRAPDELKVCRNCDEIMTHYGDQKFGFHRYQETCIQNLRIQRFQLFDLLGLARPFVHVSDHTAAPDLTKRIDEALARRANAPQPNPPDASREER